jgi:small subunit ribosomal protein S21
MSVEIRLRKGEVLDKALRRLKKKLDRENILRDARFKRYFEKPCERRRRKEKVAKFNHMLRMRYENA